MAMLESQEEVKLPKPWWEFKTFAELTGYFVSRLRKAESDRVRLDIMRGLMAFFRDHLSNPGLAREFACMARTVYRELARTRLGRDEDAEA